MLLQNKVAIVTGGSRSIGYATVQHSCARALRWRCALPSRKTPTRPWRR